MTHRIVMLAIVIFIFTGPAVMRSQAPYGEITINNCYQELSTGLNGGTFNVIADVLVSFGTTNENDIMAIDIAEVFDGTIVPLFTLALDQEIIVGPDRTFIFTPLLVPGSMSPIQPITIVTKPLAFEVFDVPNDGCNGFDEPLDIVFDFPGLCPFDWEAEYLNTTISGSSGAFSVDDEGYCTPPPPPPPPATVEQWVGMRCLDVDVTVTLHPCDPASNCPDLTVAQEVEICCNDCQPYGGGVSSKFGANGAPGSNMEQGINDLRNYPNPFTKHTTISFELPVSSRVTLEIFDAFGRVIAARDLGEMAGGAQQAVVDATELAAGVYIYRINANGIVKSGYMRVVR